MAMTEAVESLTEALEKSSTKIAHAAGRGRGDFESVRHHLAMAERLTETLKKLHEADVSIL